MVLHRLAKVARSARARAALPVVLIDLPMINALTLPGGTILVFRGLIDLVNNKLGDTDDA